MIIIDRIICLDAPVMPNLHMLYDVPPGDHRWTPSSPTPFLHCNLHCVSNKAFMSCQNFIVGYKVLHEFRFIALNKVRGNSF